MPNGTKVIEKEKLKKINKEFSERKMEVLLDKISEGKKGWDNEEYYNMMLQELMYKILKIINNEHNLRDFIHISNYAMFLWRLENEKNKR